MNKYPVTGWTIVFALLLFAGCETYPTRYKKCVIEYKTTSTIRDYNGACLLTVLNLENGQVYTIMVEDGTYSALRNGDTVYADVRNPNNYAYTRIKR